MTDANETITKADSSKINHSYIFVYDMRSQLTDANISNINGGNWVAEYSYHDNGDMAYRTITGTAKTDFTYTGNLMDLASGGESFTLTWDENGNMKKLPDDSVTTELIYNWDNKLRHGQYDTKTVDLKYDPSGNRIYKNSSEAGQRKYIVDIVGDLPVILLELDSSNNIKKTYIYANSQIIAQHDGDTANARYFYLHDRLGSVRQVIDTDANVVNCYTYDPWGLVIGEETNETVSNLYRFAGYFWDAEVSQYYCNARQYAPHIYRFTSRDPILGEFQEPLSLHRYLYCLNDPVNMVDPEGRFAYNLVSSILTGSALYAHGINLATYAVSSENWKFFDLAESTFKFMPVGMAVASVGVRTPLGKVTGIGMALFIEETTHITGMGPLEGAAMDYWSYLLYGSYMLSEQAKFGVWPWDMREFAEWNNWLW